MPASLPIDHAFDDAFANDLARLETYNKHHYRPNTYLHKWWARRCGTTFRLILKALVSDPKHADFYAPGGLAGQVILDPMMGGGTTLHEALRLGATVIGNDIDVIPILQARASLSDVPLRDLEHAFDLLYAAVSAELTPYTRTHCPHCGGDARLRYVLHGRRRQTDAGPVIVVDSLDIRRETGGATWRWGATTHDLKVSGAPFASQPVGDPLPIQTGPVAPEDDAQALPYYARFYPLIIVGECADHGRFHKLPDQCDLDQLDAADRARPDLDVASLTIAPGPKSHHLLARGITRYDELFSSRQLLYLEAARRVLTGFDPLVGLNLALLVSTSLEFNSMLCGYKGADTRRPGAIRHTFAYHAYHFPRTVLENNPLFPGRKVSGTLTNLFHRRIRRGRQWAARPRERALQPRRWVTIDGERDVGTEIDALDVGARDPDRRQFMLLHGSAAALDLPDNAVDHIVTDPPYFDSVQYGDLAAFFRVWLRQLLPDSAEWDSATTAPTAEQPQFSPNGDFQAILSDVFRECRRVLKPNGRLIFTFHHWRPEAWSALTIALRRAGFALIARYVVHSENPVSVHVANIRALTDDAVLVLSSAESAIIPNWPAVQHVDPTSSAAFCRDCATLLGYLLHAPLSEDAVEHTWRHALA